MMLGEADPRSEGRIRMTVLAGYLGSGKTTWLRHQIHAGAFKGAHIIVNEAAETPVDDALLQNSTQLSVLAGGCACCTGKAQLIALLHTLCNERSMTLSTHARLQHIVLETSGLADPVPIVDTIRSDPVLVHHIVVSEVIVTVDALHGLLQIKNEALGRKQIESADQFVMTKMDAAPVADVIKLAVTLRALNPGAAIHACIKGTPCAVPDFRDATPESLPGLDQLNDKGPIVPARIALDERIDWTAFSVWLSALLYARGDDVVRVKGVVRTAAGRLLMQTVRRVVQSPEILPDHDGRTDREDNIIVVIGRGYQPADLARSLHYFAGITEPEPQKPEAAFDTFVVSSKRA